LTEKVCEWAPADHGDLLKDEEKKRWGSQTSFVREQKGQRGGGPLFKLDCTNMSVKKRQEEGRDETVCRRSKKRETAVKKGWRSIEEGKLVLNDQGKVRWNSPTSGCFKGEGKQLT